MPEKRKQMWHLFQIFDINMQNLGERKNINIKIN